MKRKTILEKAIKCVTGKRKEDYGNPENNFALIARLWTDYCGFGFSAIDVAMMMALLKIARIKTGKGTDDCFVDLAGYAACGGEIVTEPKSMGDEWVEEVVEKMKKDDDPLLHESILSPEEIAELIAGVDERCEKRKRKKQEVLSQEEIDFLIYKLTQMGFDRD